MSNIIDNIKNIILSFFINSRIKITKEINDNIYKTFDIIFEEKFKNLTESNFSQIINEKKFENLTESNFFTNYK